MKKQANKTATATKTSKAAQAAIAATATAILAVGNAEASKDTIATDITRSEAQAGNDNASVALVSAGVLPFSEAEDKLTCTEASNEWNRNAENTFPFIELRGQNGQRPANNLLGAFDYVETPLIVSAGKRQIATPFNILTCSDDGKVVGKPFNPKTYSLLGTQKFLDVVGQITAQLDKIGVKWEIVTTGTLYNRERMFLTVRIKEDSLTTLQLDSKRRFVQFLNCLNSIPSNSGCTVTFANNSFCVCCRNTFAHCLHGKDGTEFHVALKHTRGLSANLEDVPVLVESFFTSNEALFANLRRFHAVGIDAETAANYFAAFIGQDAKGLTDKESLSTRSLNSVEELRGLFANGTGNEGKTVVDMFQAVTEYYTHFSAGESDNAWKQFQSSEAGSGAQAKADFYAWLVASLQDKSKSFDAVAKVGNVILTATRARQAAIKTAK